MVTFNIITAVDKNLGIGLNGKLPWCCFADMKHFKKVTNNTILLMGRKTWESIPIKNRNFKGRHLVIVLSRSLDLKDNINTVTAKDIYQAIEIANQHYADLKDEPIVSVCGGENIYNQIFMEYDHLINNIYITLIPGIYETDRFFNIKLLQHSCLYNHFKYQNMDIVLWKTDEVNDEPVLFIIDITGIKCYDLLTMKDNEHAHLFALVNLT